MKLESHYCMWHPRECTDRLGLLQQHLQMSEGGGTAPGRSQANLHGPLLTGAHPVRGVPARAPVFGWSCGRAVPRAAVRNARAAALVRVRAGAGPARSHARTAVRLCTAQPQIQPLQGRPGIACGLARAGTQAEATRARGLRVAAAGMGQQFWP